MFRSSAGFKAQYHYLTLLVASDFDEWRIVLQGPGVTIVGGRQITEAKAKEHARSIAESFLHQEKHEELPTLQEVAWAPLTPGEWLNWRP